MSYDTSFQNINPESEELPPVLPLFTAFPYGNLIGTIYSRATKRDCVNCGLRHSSYESKENAYCLGCTQDGKKIFYWLRKRRSVRRLGSASLVANIISRRLNVSELGILDNIVKFL